MASSTAMIATLHDSAVTGEYYKRACRAAITCCCSRWRSGCRAPYVVARVDRGDAATSFTCGAARTASS
eukprot:6198823-Pleurochrysis_carterae.AAC.12